jgi:hypothetical protein
MSGSSTAKAHSKTSSRKLYPDMAYGRSEHVTRYRAADLYPEVHRPERSLHPWADHSSKVRLTPRTSGS